MLKISMLTLNFGKMGAFWHFSTDFAIRRKTLENFPNTQNLRNNCLLPQRTTRHGCNQGSNKGTKTEHTRCTGAEYGIRILGKQITARKKHCSGATVLSY